MLFNLLTDPAFPVVARSGARRWLAFPDLAATDGDFPVDFDWPRADFNVASYEFAIGVATLALQPSVSSDWNGLWDNPPTPGALRERLSWLTFSFQLDGDGPRFLQELGGLEGEANPVEALLIDTPGVNGQKKNADLLTHRGRYDAFGLPAAAMALYALQQFAPSGGAGNRTSMRGGGPMTTLVVPGAGDDQSPLWKVILANMSVHESNEVDAEDLPRILPWLAPTLVSDKEHGGRAIHESDAHPLQAFFGMPRRVALQFGEGACAMIGEKGPVVNGFVQKPWGVNYGLWTHSLTPYRQLKPDAEPFSVKPKSARFGYRDWVAVTMNAGHEQTRKPAAVVQAARANRSGRLRASGGDARLTASGWAMNNMEAIAFLSAEQPLHLAPDSDRQIALDDTALSLSGAADEAAGLLRMALRRALFGEGAKPDTDTGLFEDARNAFYEATEDAFHEALDRRLAESAGLDEAALRSGWLKTIARAAERAFERAAPIPLDDAQRAQRIVEGFRIMTLALRGYGKLGQKLYGGLGLPVPESKGGKHGR